jgi:hypothetical protein
MINSQFLSRWPTGCGVGYIGYSRSLKAALTAVGPLNRLAHTFEVHAVRVSNTGALRDGSAEVMSTSSSRFGPLFLPVSAIFDSESEAAADINAALQWDIETKLKAIETLQRDIQKLEASKIKPVSATIA